MAQNSHTGKHDGKQGGKGDRRGGGPRRAANALARVTDKTFRRRGFLAGTLIPEWPAIVGEDVAAWCVPDKLTFPRGAKLGGTLYVVVRGGRALELQHLEPILVQRINTVFGYRAVEKLALRQGVPAPRPPRQKATERNLSDDQERALETRVAEIGDDNLRQALARLGRSVLGRSPRERPVPKK